MEGAAHDPALARKLRIPQKVARDFVDADTGRDLKKLPKRKTPAERASARYGKK